ncbi:MAG TPA: carboxypeptidase-like regulatory domain-containing protein, partial [Ohtaekwangia sp.]|uniref:carboxypeptidase-like regulatory domain-containing protein n=1 Tax=Ohtaekwangia sp. TaxID=2066019 RepID=UPI002F931907
MRKILLLCLSMAFSLTFSEIIAQEQKITGTVTGSDGQPIPGVTIVAKETALGTTTDANGAYSLSVPSSTTTLVFSFVGLKTKEVQINGQASIDVTLEDDATQLTEVVVVGYGTQERGDITGSISQVKGDAIRNLPITTYEQGLQGRTPGVQISSSSGELGSAVRIRVRGSSSVTASNQPLVVIDGFVVTATDQSNFADNNTSNPLADLNPNDIESVEVLKDASSSAIYGSRASNGVILITTRRGSQGKTQFNVNYSTGFSKPTHLRKFLNRDQYVEMFTEAAKNSGYSTRASGLDSAWADYGG